MIEAVYKQKKQLYSKRINTILRKFLSKTPVYDQPYIERYISAIKVMDIVDPGRIPFPVKDTTKTKRGAFFALLSRLITIWWDWNQNPGKESELLVVLKEVEKLSEVYYLRCELKGDVQAGFVLEVSENAS